MSLRNPKRLWITAALLAAALPSAAQYPGQVTKTEKNAPALRAVAVFEWTGDEAKPKASRLIPICIYDGQALEDADEYLARPAPIALESEVEYQLLQDGKPVGLFDVERAGQQMGFWIGLGRWKPLPRPKPAPTQVAKIDEYGDAQSDEPVLHRKHHANESGSGKGSGNSGAASNAPPPDPDRPVLRPAPDTSTASNSSSGSASTDDSDRPKLKKRKGNEEDEGYVTSVAKLSDPNRPHLFRGKTAGYGADVAPSLSGMPREMKQMVAVSDAVDRPVHLWSYSWANPGDEARMKAALEDLARAALGLNPPAAPVKPKTAAKTSSRSQKPAQLTLPPQPAPLLDEEFRVFELAYGSGATMVLSAHTAGTGAEEKFVTLIAQPDLYGGMSVLVKNVTDAAHLDDKPRMKLVDAVDALADNRGELLFELRGATQRQFALYRVLRGDATRIFLSNAAALGSAAP